ncbi:MAG: aminotransferase class V-fold PLP-dependent enzyme [Armatimonadetes bacterium]|nr:aminotransferase class V-fold PLP-dependent enzyme [Armatimonadota bacterium]
MSRTVVDPTFARSQFPALQTSFAFLENAGGSQVPGCVIDAMGRFLRESNVQTTAGYPASDRVTRCVDDAHTFCETLMGAEDKGKVVLGPSTSQLLSMLATCLKRRLEPGDEIVVSVANHEANYGPWSRIATDGVRLTPWGVDAVTGESRVTDLQRLLTPKSKIVAFPHTSNLLGNVADVTEITRAAHAVGAIVVVDGVAYAPHRLMETAAWGVDFYAFSAYKVYGPHMAALYGTHDGWAGLEGPNHFFVPQGEVPRKFELGCLPFEGCAGLSAIGDYLSRLADTPSFSREAAVRSFDLFQGWESVLTSALLAYLGSKSGVRIVGPTEGDRVPTVSFVSDRVPAPAVSAHVNARDIGIRHGHMYSHRLTEALGVDPETGFVRISAVHTNTMDEIGRLCSVLDEIL